MTTALVLLTGDTSLDPSRFGLRAARLAGMAAAGGRIAPTIALGANALADLDAAKAHALGEDIAARLGPGPLVIRASVFDPAWGGPAPVLHLGPADTDARVEFAVRLLGLDPLLVPEPADPDMLDTLWAHEELTPFPATPAARIAKALQVMAVEWARPTARILRQAQGAPADAPLALIVQPMLAGRTGQITGLDEETGARIAPAFMDDGTEVAGAQSLLTAGAKVLRDAPALEVCQGAQGLQVLDLGPARRKRHAELQVLTDLVDAGHLTEAEAVARIDPGTLAIHIHPQIARNADVDLFGTGIAASPGAARGPLVFTAEAAQRAEAQGEKAILVRSETRPEDIRGMNSATGVLTLTGGTSSHAAVIAQGIGVPCVVGAGSLRIDAQNSQLVAPDGRRLSKGDMVTLDGSSGRIIAGAVPLRSAVLSDAFRRLMGWADDIRQLKVRANADTPADARMAQRFEADGIGLCRSEHMFYAADRLDVMREMILADDALARADALARLLPMQREDFIALFETMAGMPVTIRLLDPPLHEFLPKGEAEISALAEAIGMDLTDLRRRIDGLSEYNPMLGKRGVRLAVVKPEIYAMQARAIFEAALAVEEAGADPVTAEIMIPLVSAHKEVVLVRENIAQVAQLVAQEAGRCPAYRLGVMVETPRAVLRAGDLAREAAFLSFGTNDLTQMTYGLSRDDAGRFMRDYVNKEVFAEDPFLSLDREGVGELIAMAVARGRAANQEVTFGICGEHGGDPESVRFFMEAGLDYVSCSPFRVPIARLAAAQAHLLRGDSVGDTPVTKR